MPSFPFPTDLKAQIFVLSTLDTLLEGDLCHISFPTPSSLPQIRLVPYIFKGTQTIPSGKFGIITPDPSYEFQLHHAPDFKIGPETVREMIFYRFNRETRETTLLVGELLLAHSSKKAYEQIFSPQA